MIIRAGFPECRPNPEKLTDDLTVFCKIIPIRGGIIPECLTKGLKNSWVENNSNFVTD